MIRIITHNYNNRTMSSSLSQKRWNEVRLAIWNMAFDLANDLCRHKPVQAFNLLTLL